VRSPPGSPQQVAGQGETENPDDLPADILAAYKTAKLPLNAGRTEDRLLDPGVASILQVGDHGKLAALKVLEKAGRLNFQPEYDNDRCYLGELLYRLAELHEPNVSGFKEGKGGQMPTAMERLQLLKNVNPGLGRCNDPLSLRPIDYAFSKGMKYVIDMYSASPHPEVQALREAPLSPWRIAQTIGDALSREIREKKKPMHTYCTETTGPFAFSLHFRQGVWHLGYRGGEYSRPNPQNIQKAIERFTLAAERSVPGVSPSESLQVQLHSYLNLILIHKKNELKDEDNIRQTKLMDSIRAALAFIDTRAQLPEHQDMRLAIAKIYGEAMQQWASFSEEEKEEMRPRILDQIRKNEVFFDASTSSGFREALYMPEVMQGTDGMRREHVLEALHDAEALLSSHEPKSARTNIASRFVSNFLNEIDAAEWKKTQATDKLKNILRHKNRTALFYFDLFVHAQDPAAKHKIAKAAFERHKRPVDLPECETPPAHKVLSLFAWASMRAHHLLEEGKNQRSGMKRLQSPETRASDTVLDGIARALHQCISVVLNSLYFDPGHPFFDGKGKEADRPLLIDTAVRSISLLAGITSKRAANVFTAEQEEDVALKIGNVLKESRKSLEGYTRDSPQTKDPEYADLRKQLIEHIHHELDRTEE
jgi:hypothetical protein